MRGSAVSMSKNAILTSQNAWKIMPPTKESRKTVLHVEERDFDIAECVAVQSPCRRKRFRHRRMLGKLCHPPRRAGKQFSMSKNAILTSRNASQRRRSILHVEERDSDIAECVATQEKHSPCRRTRF